MTAVGSTYTASYDAAGNMTCRAPTNTVTCSGTPTGAAMTYDNERRLATWQNQPSNPTSTAAYWYDGEGHRVAQTLSGTTTYYVGDDEEITGSTLLKYYHIPGLPVLGTIVGVTRTYLASDGLGSESVDLSYNGSVLATALYGPYGVGRYATGTMPSSKGYTGQRQDSGSGLDYYNARYYDGAIGQFTSADTLPDVNPIVFGGEPQVAAQLLKASAVQLADRYGYVGDNPETMSDPTGRRVYMDATDVSYEPRPCQGPRCATPVPAPVPGGPDQQNPPRWVPGHSTVIYVADWQAQQAKDIAGATKDSLTSLIQGFGLGAGVVALIKNYFKKFGPLAAYYGSALAVVAIQLGVLAKMFNDEHNHSLDWFKDPNNLEGFRHQVDGVMFKVDAALGILSAAALFSDGGTIAGAGGLAGLVSATKLEMDAVHKSIDSQEAAIGYYPEMVPAPQF